MSVTETTDDTRLESRLIGWKRISNYLGCSERTARRWEREEDLPVHRHEHDKRSTVFALPAELDTWLSARADLSTGPETGKSVSTANKKGPAVAALAIALLAVVALIALWPRVDTDSADTDRDPVAVDLYERGTALWEQRGEVPNQRAIKLLTQAVERDENYAEAWSALALAWITFPTYSNSVSPSDATDEALLAADRALQLDPGLAEARSIMATVARSRGDWLASERIYRNALALDPDNTNLMLWFAGHYRELGLIDKAMELVDAALAQEPNSPPILTEAAMNNFQLGHLQESRRMLDYLWFDLGVETPIVWVGRWFALLDSDDYPAAIEWVDNTPLVPFAATLRSYSVFRSNPPADARPLISEMAEAHANGFPGWLAYHMLDQSGLSEPALEILDKETADGFMGTSVVLFMDRGGDARKGPEFADYLERLGFYEYWLARGAPDMCAPETDYVICQRLSEAQGDRS